MKTPSNRQIAKIFAGVTFEKFAAAVRAYITWQRRQERYEHPEGTFDSKRRWYPSRAENLDGLTDLVRSPSARYPFSYMLAARSLWHCENLQGLNEKTDHELVLSIRRAGIFERFSYRDSDAEIAAKTAVEFSAIAAACNLIEQGNL